MKALTLLPDWAMLMFQGEKTVEFRTWKTDYRGDVIICSSARKVKGCISGHALLVANLVEVVPFTKSHLDAAAMDYMPSQKGYAWIFEDVRMIDPVPVKGRLGLFELDIPINFVPPHFSEEEADDYIAKHLTPIIWMPCNS